MIVEQSFSSLLADMEKAADTQTLCGNFLRIVEIFKLLKVIHFYGGITTLYCNNFLLIFK